MAPTPSPTRIRALRHGAALSRRELAGHTGLSVETIIDYERGRSTPSAAALGRLAAALDCPVDALYGGQQEARATTCDTCRVIFRVVDAARAVPHITAPDQGGPDAA